MKFSDRRRLTESAESYCNKNGMSINAFNIVTALDVLGFIHQVVYICPNCGSNKNKVDIGNLICTECNTHYR